jgi:hypothetical protein
MMPFPDSLSLLFRAIFYKLLPLRSDYPLLDSLFKTVKVRLRHTKLHLVSLLLTAKSL